MSKTLNELIATGAALFFISTCMKLLAVPYPEHYSDITYVHWRTFALYGNPLGAIPYVSYYFEYPALVGYLFYISALTPNYGWAMFFFMIPFAVGTIYFLYRICELMEIDSKRIFFYLIFTPTWLLFSFYNWDILAVFFIALAIYLHMKNKERLCGISLGLGMAAKIYPVLMLPLILQGQKSWRIRIETMVLAGATYGLLSLPFIVMNFSGWWHSLAGTYIYNYPENTWWIYVQLALLPMDYIKPLSIFIFGLFLVYILRIKRPLIQKAWITYAVLFLSSTTYTPQFNLALLPLFVLNPTFSLIPFYLFDTMNGSIILFWFSPTPPGSIWLLGTLRQLVLLLLLVQFVSQKPLPKLKYIWKWLTTPIIPLEEKPKEVVVKEKIVKKPVKILPKIKKMVTFLVSPIEEEEKEKAHTSMEKL